MKIHGTILKDGTIQHTANQRAYFQKFVGKPTLTEIDERTNIEKIGFIEGAIKQFFFYQHLKGVYKDFTDARNGLKWACNYTKFEIDDKGRSKEVTRSMSEIYANNKRTQWFINKCEEYFRENGYQFPDNEHFKAWRDSGVGVNDIYPPTLELKKKYDAKANKDYPWRE